MPFQIMSFYCGWLITILARNQNINVRRSSIIAELKQLDMDSNAHFPGTNETGFISSLRGGGMVIQQLSKQRGGGYPNRRQMVTMIPCSIHPPMQMFLVF